MSSVRASSRWFARRDTNEFSSYMTQFANHLFPYEFTTVPSSEKTKDELDPVANFLCWLSRSPNPMDAVLAGILQSAMPLGEDSESRFFMFEAPLSLIMRASEFNKGGKENLTRLYIAQSQIPDLPPQLQDDLETPRLVREAGKGDVYNSSIWIGLEPTFTPLHRDPNPNLFLQLLGGKIVRLMPPTVGEQMYREVQDRLRRSGSSRIRGFEMMDGPERVMLSAAAWGMEVQAGCVEAQLGAGDALFIPKGWWHSVKSARCDGRLNASVNWWFR